MKRAIGWNAGMRGDIIMNTVVARAFKEAVRGEPWHVTLAVGPQYADMEPLFHAHPHIDAFYAYDSYDGWPNEKDRAYLDYERFDHVFDAMPQHAHPRWHDYVHQCQEACWMHGLNAPSDGLQCHLNQWFSISLNRDTIAFAPFAGYYSPNNDKRLSTVSAQQVVDLIRSKGYKVLQLGGADEPALEGAAFPKLSYFESVRAMLGCAMLIHTDTGMGWVASAYGFPQIGLYNHTYYGEQFIKNVQPINPRSIYLNATHPDLIGLDAIETAIDSLL